MLWRSSLNSRLAQIADFITAIFSFLFSYLCWILLEKIYARQIPDPIDFDLPFIFLILFLSLNYVYLFRTFKAYNLLRFTSLATEYTIVFRVCFIAFLVNLAIAFFFNFTDLRRTFFFLSFIIALALFFLQKSFLFYLASLIREKGKNRKRVLVVGTGKGSENLINVVKHNFSWGLDIIGLLNHKEERIGDKYYGIQIVGTYDQIEEVLKNYNPEEVLITVSTKHFDQVRSILEACEKMGIQVRWNSDFFGHLAKNVRVDNVLDLNIISFDYTRQSEIELFIKRIMDVFVSFILLILLLPFMLIIAIVIYREDGFPVFYQWKVVGKDRKPITSWKFRTMVKNADQLKKKLMKNNEMTGPMFKMTNDPRILPIGKFLRKYSLDELPQLLSVLKGDLSLVGPRPPLQSEYKEFDLWHRRKLSVKPGLTCLWQISGRNKINDFNEWAKLDLQYIDNWSLWFDIVIFIKTIISVLKGTGK
jgi:exopolysaccharide biosynthesis polyprenyl glycosylphosphotransferase